MEDSKKENELSVDHVTRHEINDPTDQSKGQGSSVEFVHVQQPTGLGSQPSFGFWSFFRRRDITENLEKVDISRNPGRPYQKSSGFQASFPISFLLVVKGAHGLPHIRENHFSTPTSPLVHLSIRSCVLDEGQITIRTSERLFSFTHRYKSVRLSRTNTPFLREFFKIVKWDESSRWSLYCPMSHRLCEIRTK